MGEDVGRIENVSVLVYLFAKPVQGGGEVAGSDALPQIRNIVFHLKAEAGCVEISDGVAREVAEQSVGPVHIL